MRLSVATLCVVLTALFACKTVKEKITGAEPAASAAPAASASAVASAEPAPTGPVMPPPTTVLPKPLQTGQFVRYKVTDKGKEREFSYSVLGAEGDAHWIQVVSERDGRRIVIQILLAIGNRAHPTSAKVRGVKMKMGNMVREFRGATLAAIRKSVDGAMAELTVPGIDGLPQQDVTVPAGTFRQCYKRESTVTFVQIQDKARQWLHPGVPVLAMVKTESMTEDYKMELVAFGDTGAKDELQ